MHRHIITISGGPGSGKSSTANRVSEQLGYRRFSSGDFMRQIGLERGLTIDEMQTQAERDHSIDHAIDAAIRKTGEQEEIVIDSRIAFHWLPESFKVLLTLDPHIAAERTFKQIQEQGRMNQNGDSIEEIHKHLLARIESEKKRYKSLYDIDYPTVSDFDLVIDTATHSLDQVVDLIVEEYRKKTA